MRRPIVILLCLYHASALAQRIIDTVAGGYIPSEVPASGVELISTYGLTGDAQGDIYFVDSRYVIRQIRKDGIIETVAGNGISQVTGDGGPAIAASLGWPTRMASDGAGNLFVLDGCRIRRIDASGNIATVTGTGICGSLGSDGPATLAQIDTLSPSDIAVGSDGAVYFSEWSDNRVRKLTSDGHIVLVAGAPQPANMNPVSDGDGGPATAAHLFQPTAIAADPSGKVYVVDNGPAVQAYGKIRRIAPDGTISSLASAVAPIHALAVGAQGALYEGDCPSSVVGLGSCQIRRVGADGTMDTVAGGPSARLPADGPAASVFINTITNLFADAGGNIYFGDGLPVRIRRVTPQSMVETIAGGAPVYAPDGPDARQAWLVNPTGITADRSGNIYTAENCMIRMVAPSGAFTTLAGTGRCAGTAQQGPVAATDLPVLSDLAVTSQGQIYAATQGQLLSIVPGKTIALVAGMGGAQRLAIDSQDWLYALSTPARTVTRLKPGAAPELFIAPFGLGGIVTLTLSNATAIAVDSTDNLYVLSYRITPGGQVSSSHPPSDSSINASSLAVDARGNLYGTNNLGLFGFASNSGWPALGFAGDGGPLLSAAMQYPTRLIIAPSGAFYFIDTRNGRIRKITGSPPAAVPAITAAGVVNAASGAASAVAPGELISIYGTNLGPASAWVNNPENNSYPTVAGYTRLLVNTYGYAFAAPILLASANQINAFVPYYITGGGPLSVQVEVDGVLSSPVTLNFAASAFGLFTANGSGSGQGAILNQDGSYNSTANPASRGSIVSLYGTGDGLEAPTLTAGALVLSTPYPTTAAPVTVRIGGQPADVLYTGAAPFLPAGITQINGRIPQGVATVEAPIVVSIGGVPTTQAVTVAVK